MIAVPSTRCYPKDDQAFIDDVAAAVVMSHADLDAALPVLRAKYPRLRISVRSPIAGFGESVWYCYRDGSLVVHEDGVGAMRLWTPIERLTRQSVDLLDRSYELVRQAEVAIREAEAAGSRLRGQT